jgi:radical SAM protein with 4Fe4S-binding SPASM domain
MSIVPSKIKGKLHTLYKAIENKDHQLLYLFLEITRTCNLACRHCGSDCGIPPSPSELTTQSWIAILKHIAQQFNPLPTIVLTGGEPILHPDFKEIIRAIASHGLRWGMVSNGYDLDRRTVELLQKHTVYSITISLDGLEENHNWLRGKKDSFNRTMEAIEHVSASTIPVKDVVTCVNNRNLHELDSIAQLLIAHSIPSWRLFRIFPSGRAIDNDELLLSVKGTRHMLDWIAAHKKAFARKGLDCNFSCEGWLPAKIDGTVRNQPFFCRSGINIASILSDGRITGCSNNSDNFIEGNILRDNFAFVWKNRFEKFRNRSWVNETECGKCDHVKECQGSSIHLWRSSLVKPEFCYAECF